MGRTFGPARDAVVSRVVRSLGLSRRSALERSQIMRWQMGRQSDNVEDRRGMGVPLGIAGGGIGTVILIIAGLIFGFDPSVILQGGGGDPSSQVAPGPGPAPSKADDEMRKFVSVVLADTEDVWSDLFRKRNAEYRDPKLV